MSKTATKKLRKGVMYAHTGEANRLQTCRAHDLNVARMSREFGKTLGVGQQMYSIGLLHDFGKRTPEFQERLQGGVAVDHSSAGAVKALSLMRNNSRAQWMYPAQIISAHHTGLPDFGDPYDDEEDKTYFAKMKRYARMLKAGKVSMPQVSNSLNAKYAKIGNFPHMEDPLDASFMIRYGYSCLTDADFLDTEAFMRENAVNRKQYDSLELLRSKLDDRLTEFKQPKSPIARYRNSILKECIRNAQGRRGLYSLTVPTGGGKTLTSMKVALDHAMKNEMDRVIYVSPYTSIIDQNADVFKGIFGDKNVLEHHSGMDYQYDWFNPEQSDVRALATENWDMPIVVTTTVQFFESLFANRASKARKIHNIANSVIIVDEVQLIPFEHLMPCVAALAALVRLYKCTVILCTATQPYLKELIQDTIPADAKELKIRELCKSYRKYYDKFRRCSYRSLGEYMKVEDVAEVMKKHEQVLCVVNTRAYAQEIYDMLPEEGRYHLSTYMSPFSRRAIIAIVKQRLAEGKPCRLISTSLIEAGVDLDFPCAMRQMAGLDSLLQTGGRCNREGKRDAAKSLVYVFDIYHGQDKKDPLKRSQLEKDAALCSSIIRNIGARRINSLEAISTYFHKRMEGASVVQNNSKTVPMLDRSDVVNSFKNGINGCAMPFETVSSNFHLIDQKTRTVYVPQDAKSTNLIRQMVLNGRRDRRLFRSLAQYSVSLYEDQIKALMEAGVCETTDLPETPEEEREWIFYLTQTEGVYDDWKGIIIPEKKK